MSKFLMVVGVLAFAVIVGGVLGLFVAPFVMLLWNAVVPSIFGLTAITYWQAYFIYMLCYILFHSSSGSSNKD